MASLIYEARDESATDALGTALARALPAGTVVGLRGTLGAGKTRLVQAVSAALGVPTELVVSPTFVLIHEYHGTRPIHHFDAYRLEDDDQFLELGPEEYFASPGLTLIEWADRVERCLPRERIDIQIDVLGTTTRRFTIRAVGARYEPVVKQVAAALSV